MCSSSLGIFFYADTMEYYKNLKLEDLFYINDDGLVCCEEWKDIIGYEGFYQVSTLARIKSLDRLAKVCGGSFRKVKSSILRQRKNKGYCMVDLNYNLVKITHQVHRLVAIAFIPNPDNKPVVNHKDFNRSFSFYLNLEWCSYKENTEHASYNNRFNPRKGDNHSKSKLTEKKVLAIRRLYNINPNYDRFIIASKLNVDESTIRNVITRKHFKHI